MLKSSKIALTVLLALGGSAVAAAQTNAPAAPDNPTPTFRFGGFGDDFRRIILSIPSAT